MNLIVTDLPNNNEVQLHFLKKEMKKVTPALDDGSNIGIRMQGMVMTLHKRRTSTTCRKA